MVATTNTPQAPCIPDAGAYPGTERLFVRLACSRFENLNKSGSFEGSAGGGVGPQAAAAMQPKSSHAPMPGARATTEESVDTRTARPQSDAHGTPFQRQFVPQHRLLETFESVRELWTTFAFVREFGHEQRERLRITRH